MTDTHHRTLEARCNALAQLQVHFAEAIHDKASELRLSLGTGRRQLLWRARARIDCCTP